VVSRAAVMIEKLFYTSNTIMAPRLGAIATKKLGVYVGKT